MAEFPYRIVDHIDFIFEESNNMYSALRKVAWGDSPDDKAKLEVRRWQVRPDGQTAAAKGMTFLTEEGPSELTNCLLKLGYGHTKEVLSIIKDRDDFKKSLNSVLGKDDENYDESAGTLEDDYFDPKELLG
jgi:hypothetical protein